MSTSKILFQLSGSIACFKACAVISSLVKAGVEVEVVATRSALKFVGEATLEGLTGRRVHTDTFEAGSYMNHIHLVRWADAIILCPASANTLNKFAAGVGDDLVSTMFLAHDFKKPFLVAPAMNQTMYAHPATQASLAKLNSWGITVLETGIGALACGEHGEGRMLEPDQIFSAINEALSTATATNYDGQQNSTRNSSRELNAHASDLGRILITSGGTEEPIDGVRSITNTSSGRTGAALASTLAEQGYSVTLLHAKSAATPSRTRNIEMKNFTSFASLQHLLTETLQSTAFNAVIHLAAVADYSLAEIESNGAVTKAPVKGKIDAGEELTLKLKKNPKLIDTIRANAPNAKIIAFKLTRTMNPQERETAVTELAKHANADYIVHNDLNEIQNGNHPFTIFSTRPSKDPNVNNNVNENINGNVDVNSNVNGAPALARKLATLIEEGATP